MVASIGVLADQTSCLFHSGDKVRRTQGFGRKAEIVLIKSKEDRLDGDFLKSKWRGQVVHLAIWIRMRGNMLVDGLPFTASRCEVGRRSCSECLEDSNLVLVIQPLSGRQIVYPV